MPTITCTEVTAQWEIPRQVPALKDALHVWRIQIQEHLGYLRHYAPLLSHDEHARAGTYYSEGDRDRFIISRGALRMLLGGYTEKDPAGIHFDTSENKKPFIKSANQDIHFNTAHSGNVILIAICNSAVGIDVEQIEGDFDYNEVLPSCFSDAEQDAIRKAANVRAMFYTLWTRKEALLKAIGKGIDDEMPQAPCLDGTHRVSLSLIGSDKDWMVRSFQVQEGYVATVASGEGWRPYFLSGSALSLLQK